MTYGNPINVNTLKNMEFGLGDAELSSSLHEMLTSSSQLLFNSEYSTEDVLDMIPVRPIGEDEENIRTIFSNRLTGLYSKLTKK